MSHNLSGVSYRNVLGNVKGSLWDFSMELSEKSFGKGLGNVPSICLRNPRKKLQRIVWSFCHKSLGISLEIVLPFSGKYA